MTIRNKTESLFLFLGDAAFFYLALYLALLVRFRTFAIAANWHAHVVPFSILFAVWIVVYYIAGLYGKHTLILKSRLPVTMLNVALVNAALAIGFFYLVPVFGIEPRLTLFVYLVIAFVLALFWRIKGQNILDFRPRYKALLIGSGEEMERLTRELVHNKRYNLDVQSSIDLSNMEQFDVQKDIVEPVYAEGISVVVINMHHPKIAPVLPHLYNLLFARVRFIDMHKVYEDLFDRVPLSLLRHSWFLENISLAPHVFYDAIKRAVDIVVAVFVGTLSLVLYPLVALAIKLDDGGPVFIAQPRVGQNNRPIIVYKFRTMRFNRTEVPDTDEKERAAYNAVTSVGRFLRRSRIDELPQLWNVLRGDLSLIGPRPELPNAVKHYEAQIAFYGIRHLVKPGLSGWAQIHHQEHPHHGLDVEETRNKLSYDLYYLKNRSLMLDVKILLRTLQILLQRVGA